MKEGRNTGVARNTEKSTIVESSQQPASQPSVQSGDVPQVIAGPVDASRESMSQPANNNEEQKNLIEEIKIEEVPSNGSVSAPKDEAKP